MFTAIAPMLGEDDVMVVEISGVNKAGLMKVVVKPKLAKGGNPVLAIPLALAATPQELDAEFVGTLMEFGGQRQSLKEQVAVTMTILSAAQQAESGKAIKGLQGKAGKPAALPAPQGSDDSDNVLDGNGIVSAPTAPKASVAPAANNDDLLSLIG